ncbi:MAG: hypothetical protein ABJB47_12530 [Actinomycetota bacterium]
MTDTLKIGSSVSQADSYAFDLNGDGRTDDALGHVLAGIFSVVSTDTSIASSLRSGDTVILHSLHARSLDADRKASWHVYVGTARPHPVLSGGGRFAIDPAKRAFFTTPFSF